MAGWQWVALLRPHPVAVRLALVLLGAAAAATETRAVIVAALRPEPAVPESYRLATEPRPAVGLLSAIAARNLFAARRDEVRGGPGELVAALGPCRAPIAVRATLVAEGVPEWSMALVALQRAAAAEVYSVNLGSNVIGDELTLIEVRECAVVVDRGGARELCRCHEAGAATAVVTSDGAPAVVALDRAALAAALADLPRLAGQLRLVPGFVDGRLVGFRVHGLAAGGLVARLGLERGDLLESIAGYQLADSGDLWPLLEELRTASRVEVGVRRGGERQVLRYDIR